MKNCKCIRKTCRGPYFRKKCPVSKSKRKCSRNNQLVTTKIIRQIHSTNRKFCPEAGSPFREQICIENIKIRIEPIQCPNNYEIITCIVSKNIKKVKKYYYKVVNCICVKAVIIVKTRPCKPCRKPITHESSCGPLNADGIGYAQITTKYWKITKKNICKPHIKNSERICDCGKRRIVKECVNGKKIFKTIIYEVESQCKPRISIISESISCYNNGRPNKWLFERIHHCRSPGEFTIKYFVRMQFNPKTCGCRRVDKSVRIDICCRPCRYRTVCRHNNKIVTISDCQRSEKLKCVNFKIETSVSLKCPKPVKRVIGDCKGRVIRYRIISYKSVQCQCVKTVKEYIQNKISDVTKCINEMWRTTHIGYELYDHECVPKRPQIIFRQIFCPKFETFKDERINQCDFFRSYFRKFLSNCRCVDRFVRKEILHYKCCQKPIISKRCANHNTKVVVTTNFNLVNFKCYKVRRELKSTVDCSHEKSQKRKRTSQCTYKIEYYYGASEHCKCIPVYKFNRPNLHDCCDHLQPHKEQKCDEERGRLINILYTYKLVGQRCPQQRSITYTPINCDGQICERRYGKCIQNTRTIELFCLKRQGCQCVKQIFKRHNVCCGRKKDSIWTEIGRCSKNRVYHQRGYYQLIKTYALRLDYRTNQCTPVVIKQQYKICRCDESFVEKSCFKDIYIKTKIFSYQMDESKNVCHERIDESISLVSECYKTLKITLNERETTPDGWCIRTSKIITPVKCKCLKKIVENRFPCPCYKPVSVKQKKYCIKNNIIVVEKHIPRCRLNNIYWRIDKTIIPILDCSRLEIVYSSAYRSFLRRDIIQNESEAECCTRYMYETLYQWYLDNCKCKAKIIKLRLVCIACMLPHQKEECLGSKINAISYSYSIVDGICRRTVNKELIHIPCPTQPKIHQSKCINNIYTITTTNYFYDNCRCKSRVEKKTCDCQCGKDSKVIRCSGNYFFNEITTKYYRRDCRCFKTVNDKQIEPRCPRFIHLSIGNCEIQKHYSIYRKITTRRLDKDYRNCKCNVISNPIDEVCDCKKQITKHDVCINNNKFVIQTWGWRFNENKKRCDKVIIHVDSKFISCSPTRIDKVCNYNIEKGEETTTKYKLVKCKCIENKIVKQISCKCKPKVVREHRGECRNNIRIEVYSRKEARGKHCVTVKERKYVICCPPSEKSDKFCNYYQFVHYHTSINEFCQRRNIVTYIPVRCSQEITKRETGCYRYGFKFIWFYGQTVHNCRCIRRVIRLQFCRCRCYGNRIFRKCHWSGRAIINIQISFKHVGCSCILSVTRNIQPIQCPLSNVIVSKCNEVQCRGYWFRTTTITNHHIRHCICVRSVTTIKSICKIKIFKEFSVTCDRKRRFEIRKETKLIFLNGECIKITKENRTPITCNNKWVIANNPICHLDGTEIRIYQKLSFNDCRCHTTRKVKRCDCRCKSPFVLKKCQGNIFRLYFYQYELKRCKCKGILKRTETESIHCKSEELKVGPCFEKNNLCVKNVEYQESVLVNCQCIKRRKIIENICHSCCIRPSSTSTYCHNLSNKFITTVTTCQVYPSGHIERISQITSQGISCEVGTICVSENNCDRSKFTETLVCTTKTLENCVCISKTEKIKRDSCVCGLPKLKPGVCNFETCIQPVYQIESKLVVLKNNEKTCDKVDIKLRDETCCCLKKSSSITECINNRLIQKIEKYTYINEKKTCISEISQNDITEPCGPAIEKFPGSCDQTNGKQNNKIIMKQLVNCKCKITEHVETEVCYCLGNRVETKCIGELLETINYKYTLNNEKNQCILTVDKNQKKVECPMPDTDSVKFDVNSVEQCKKTEYKVENCKCVPVITPVSCSCPETCPKDTVAESCIPEKGVLRIVSKKHNFEKEGCKCTSTTKTEDKQIKCAETPRKEISTTTTPYENGDYYIVTTTFERRENCECVKQSSNKYVLVRCADKYNKTNSQNELYDFKCEKIPEPIKPTVICPENSTNSLGNGKNEVTYYVIQNEKCVKQTTVTKCEECKIQYCAEDSTSCDRSKCSEDAVRATCPITCGVCELCNGNDSKCETNPFDSKQYRKKEQ